MPRAGLLAGVVLLALAVTAAAVAGEEPEGSPRLERRSYQSSATGAERDYFVYLPAGYDLEARDWPMILFLHGDGERGDGKEELEWAGVHGPLFEAWVMKRDLPFVIVVPQLPVYGRDEVADYLRDRDPGAIPRRLADGVPDRPAEFPTPEPMVPELAADPPFGVEGPPDGWQRLEADLIHILDAVLEASRVDPERVYLTGLSYGGFGSWHMASRHPDRFAALAPVVGFGDPGHMPPIARSGMPVWAFAGGRDSAVPVRYFWAGLNELERLGHPDVRFTIHADMGHDVWSRVYAGEDLYDWLLVQRRAARSGSRTER